jgi:Golgi SNAP receptor complex protein 1
MNPISNSGTSWDALLKRAKYLEGRLEINVQKYSALAQKINADFLCDEENPLMDSKEEQSLATEIEKDLNDLADCIAQMRTGSFGNSGAPLHHQEGLVKRYHEIHFDYSTEFKNTSATVHRKRESMELFQSSKALHSDEPDSSIAKILRERNSIAASMRSINDVISQAFEAKNTLLNQRSTLTGTTGGLSTLAANVPSFNKLIEGIQKKKSRESTIVAVVIGALFCFTIWWMFLR